MYEDEFDMSDMAGEVPIVPDQKPGEKVFAAEKKCHRHRKSR